MKKIFDFIKTNLNTWLTTLLACVIIYQVYNLDTKTPEFHDFKD